MLYNMQSERSMQMAHIEVPLTQSKVALIDEIDAERVLALGWYAAKVNSSRKRGDQAMVDRALDYLAETQQQLGVEAASPRNAVWKLRSSAEQSAT
jgi:hypothetical protein